MLKLYFVCISTECFGCDHVANMFKVNVDGDVIVTLSLADLVLNKLIKMSNVNLIYVRKG